MNDAEPAAVIDDHFTAEARTLADQAEANLLKLAELRGTLTPEQARRWTDLKAAHVRARVLGGSGEEPVARAVAALGPLADRLAALGAALGRAAHPRPAAAATPARYAAGRPQGTTEVPGEGEE
ncbi:hypothetical protein [Streptomyces mexicanus]|uniref:hypothetical protein n=1 Tax=Streptomyces mexicanus TaxID=178566 RepID=UPI00368625A2